MLFLLQDLCWPLINTWLGWQQGGPGRDANEYQRGRMKSECAPSNMDVAWHRSISNSISSSVNISIGGIICFLVGLCFCFLLAFLVLLSAFMLQTGCSAICFVFSFGHCTCFLPATLDNCCRPVAAAWAALNEGKSCYDSMAAVSLSRFRRT